MMTVKRLILHMTSFPLSNILPHEMHLPVLLVALHPLVHPVSPLRVSFHCIPNAQRGVVVGRVGA